VCKSYLAGQIIAYLCSLSYAQASHSIRDFELQSLFCQQGHTELCCIFVIKVFFSTLYVLMCVYLVLYSHLYILLDHYQVCITERVFLYSFEDEGIKSDTVKEIPLMVVG
jgi:hypothetical protein